MRCPHSLGTEAELVVEGVNVDVWMESYSERCDFGWIGGRIRLYSPVGNVCGMVGKMICYEN
jgi:hypothetical protein